MRAALLLPVLLLAACQAHRAPSWQPQTSTYVQQLRADCPAPQGWKSNLLSSDKRHSHVLWLSPSGDTAYAIIHINLPFPVAPSLVLWVMMLEMKRIEGEATLVESHDDSAAKMLRFIVQGRDHNMDGNLLVRGLDAWVVYAGTFRNKPVNIDEYRLAEKSRENTIVRRE